MANAKEKTTNFWRKHKKKIVVAGGVACGLLMLRNVFWLGLRCGTHATMTYLDANLPELELSKRYAELNNFELAKR